MNLLLLSLAPVFIIGGYIYYRDKYDKEPLQLLWKALLAGALIVIPVIFVEQLLSLFLPFFPGILNPAYHGFVVAAFTEESFKFLALFLLFWKANTFNEKFDGIVYATFISLGFAGVENVMYVLQYGVSTGITRAITAVPAHAVFGVTMGFYVGQARFYDKQKKELLRKAIGMPILLHGVYDFILMTGYNWLLAFWIAFVVFLYFSALKRIKTLSDQSIFNTDYDLLNEKFTKKQ
ncbi:PrsW family glutamic-type intramembrane protease [Maribellus maritimus]|uniref:PrsW family glutamic-type intramembrane protease n=1 Tax=Maribellus maritimus TaxID=2870838 RepID=UPI001EEAEB34|nr:PrsW family glutamic-type intramembrane protease [Maribellus maritimus]MCG6187487.1 PrsW family intramembrane metalloprotease [Maribellus maritimus]